MLCKILIYIMFTIRNFNIPTSFTSKLKYPKFNIHPLRLLIPEECATVSFLFRLAHTMRLLLAFLSDDTVL